MSEFANKINIRAEFLKECEEIKEKARDELSSKYMKVKIKSLQGEDNFFHKFIIALWQTRIESLINEKYNGVDPSLDLAEVD